MEKKPTNPLDSNPFAIAANVHEYLRNGSGPINREWFNRDIAAVKEFTGDLHFSRINPEELTDYDIRTWMWWRASTLDYKIFLGRMRNMKDEQSEKAGHPLSQTEAANDSRFQFYALMGERFEEQMAKEQLAEMQKAKQ